MAYWTQREIELVRLNYDRLTHKDLGCVLGRSANAVRNKCHRLGLWKKPPFWTLQEIEILQEYYGANEIIDMDVLERVFLGRHRTNISRKAKELGLTNQGRSLSGNTKQKISAALSEWHRENEHPRGFSGHTHTQRAKEIIGQKARAMWGDPQSPVNSEAFRQARSDMMSGLQATGVLRMAYSRGKMGKRADLNDLFVRSAWEANYARYLNWLKSLGEIKDWQYEPDIFWFEAIKRGTRSYTPDFKVYNPDGSFEYHEVKGWMDKKSSTKLKRMSKYYPDVPLILIDAEQYRAIENSVKAFIPEWE